MSQYTDNLRLVAYRINKDSLAIGNKWDRQRFREQALAGYTVDERYYLKAYLHEEQVRNQDQARRDNMGIKL